MDRHGSHSGYRVLGLAAAVKLRKRLVLLLCMLLGQVGAIAHADTWHTSKIKDVYPLSNGFLVLIFVDDAAACTSGASNKYHYIAAGAFGVNSDGLRLMAATALMAFAAEKPVSILYDETSQSCYINRLMARS